MATPTPERTEAVTSGLIYHYTDSGGLHGILSTASLWLTDILYLNDREELTYSIQVVRDTIEKRITELEPQAEPGPYWHSEVGGRIELLRRIDGHLAPEQLRGEPEHGVYVACFCRDGDLLSQWRGYAGGVGGFCIGFDPAGLIEPMLDGFGFPDAFPTFLTDVRYGSEDGRELLDPFLSTLDRFSGAHIGVNAELKTVDAVRIMAQIKHPGFAEEGEVRLIESGSWSGYAEARFRTGPRGLIPYRTHSFPKAAVREVVVGPGGGREQARAVKHLLHMLDYPDVETRESTVPFR